MCHLHFSDLFQGLNRPEWGASSPCIRPLFPCLSFYNCPALPMDHKHTMPPRQPLGLPASNKPMAALLPSPASPAVWRFSYCHMAGPEAINPKLSKLGNHYGANPAPNTRNRMQKTGQAAIRFTPFPGTIAFIRASVLRCSCFLPPELMSLYASYHILASRVPASLVLGVAMEIHSILCSNW